MPIVAAVAFGLGIKIAGLDAGERIRHLSIGDEVAPPHLDAVDAETLGRKLDQPLAEETSLVAAGRAIGSGRRLVGDESRRRKMNVRNAIRAAEKLRDIARRGQPIGADIGAEIDKNVAAQADDRAVALAGDLDLTIHLARMVSGEEMLAAILDPPYRPPQMARGERDQEIFGVKLAARTKTATDIGLDEV